MISNIYIVYNLNSRSINHLQEHHLKTKEARQYATNLINEK